MPRLQNSSVRIQIGLRGWAAITASLIILIAVPVAIAFFAIGLFVFVLPAILLAPLFYCFIPRSKPIHPESASAVEGRKWPTIINGKFRVTGVPASREKSDADNQN
jgi:hypothetical protein